VAGRGVLRLTLRTALVVVVTVVLGFVAFLGAARFTSTPVLVLAAGLLALAAGVLLGGRRLRAGPRRHRPAGRGGSVAAAVAALLVLAFALTAVLPAGPGRPAAAVPGERFWPLPSGSQLRYTLTPAQGRARPEPVVFLHGGPGTPDLAADTAYFGQLAADGFDVYVYDQFGSGGSSRADDPTAYGVDRDVGDVEAIRQLIGADRLILIGHSYGAVVAAGYLAGYPQHVARVVFSSPASLDPADRSAANVTGRLGGSRLLRLYGRLGRPRNQLVYGLLQVDPSAAHRLAGDAEMDGRNDAVYAVTEAALHCAGQGEPHPPTGTGFYRLQYPQSATAPSTADLRPALTGNPTPALVIKGSCDYLSWSSAVTYLQAFPDSRLVYLHGGRNSYQDTPGPYLSTVRAFLTGADLPVPALPTTSVPAGYEGAP